MALVHPTNYINSIIGRYARAYLHSNVKRYSTSVQKLSEHVSHEPSDTNTPVIYSPQNIPPELRAKTQSMNMCSAINDALRIAMEKDENTIILGEDVAFGGVFRCTAGLRDKFGHDRVFNTPLSEQGIIGFANGYAVTGNNIIAEIQFGDYIMPAFDQIVNEAAKFRYRSGGMWNVGSLTIRTPVGAVGHGALYHSQSPEAYFTHTPGLKIVTTREPISAKGLLLAAIREKDPVLFLEPKALYRSSAAEVPVDEYIVPLGKADVVIAGSDISLIGWGSQVQVLLDAADMALSQLNVSCEVIDLMTLLPWDEDAVIQSVSKTGRCIVSHEAPITSGFGAEVVAKIQEKSFLSLEAPIRRVCGYDTPFPLVHEKYYLPNKYRVFDAIKETMEF
eukprot:CAMPEP_0184706538 /NCGR_PEP_ID=MMETSP0313-20130426/36808_1 /TAXON_ID=2792 /ORGANISM="Porphyridium aerugineum, Strain SAG 1380-2" /LENGTH=390 /DNA_ID=CAMNT_0027168091 /DNA_START=41 /DNA_END=1216 /DNA_ORIENTATION=-